MSVCLGVAVYLHPRADCGASTRVPELKSDRQVIVSNKNVDKSDLVDEIFSLSGIRRSPEVYLQPRVDCETTTQTPEHRDEGQLIVADKNVDKSAIIDEIFNLSGIKRSPFENPFLTKEKSGSFGSSPKNDCDKISRQLAGLFIPDNMLANQARIDYARFMHREWNKLREASLFKIEDWSKKNILPHLSEDTTALFYPFGGPDIAYALNFFPRMRTYILIGLEPVGNFDSVRKNINNDSATEALKQAFSAYLSKGYFITSQMTTQLFNKDIKGTIYPLLIELVKSGFTVNDVKNLSLTPEGEEAAPGIGLLNGVKITFAPTEGGELKTVYYIRADLCNSNNRLANLTNFVKRFRFATFIKSASYVLHDKSASKIRDFILENSAAILQDDTGVPFCHFTRWNKHIFGRYTTPILSIFKGYRQTDMSDYYAKHKAVEIGFKIGYGFNADRPNLLLAIPAATIKTNEAICPHCKKRLCDMTTASQDK
jgi:hypothetical protein